VCVRVCVCVCLSVCLFVCECVQGGWGCRGSVCYWLCELVSERMCVLVYVCWGRGGEGLWGCEFMHGVGAVPGVRELYDKACV
jgi:hypothetical protein